MLKQENNKKINKRLTLILLSFVVVFVCAQLFNYYIMRVYKMPSDEMQLSILKGDYLLINQVAYSHPSKENFQLFQSILCTENIKHGDLVLVYFNDKTDAKFSDLKILRVIGLPGDQIKINNKKIYKNGELLKESYVSHSAAEEFLPLRDELDEVLIPENYYFLLADNRDVGQDSRVFGFVSINNIVGKVTKILFSYDDEYGTFRNKRTLVNVE